MLFRSTIGRCRITDGITRSLHLPRLQELALEQVKISECSLHSLIVGCPALERLLIRNNVGFRCVRINSLTLRSVSLRVILQQQSELIIENAPCLERVLCYNLSSSPGISLSVISAPKLEIIGWISDWNDTSGRHVFGSTIIQVALKLPACFLHEAFMPHLCVQ